MAKLILVLFSFLSIFGCRYMQMEDKIILINVGNADNGSIAKVISKIITLKPAVVSIDIAFPVYSDDVADRSLYQALSNVDRLVLPSKISFDGVDYQGRELISVSLACASEFFVPNAAAGFVSVPVLEGQVAGPDEFLLWQKSSYSQDTYYHFSIETVMAFDSALALQFVRGHGRLAKTNYGKRKFITLSASDVLQGRLNNVDIKGKIVMIGFLGPGDEDRFIVPDNLPTEKRYIYGLEYLANIVAQVLEWDNK